VPNRRKVRHSVVVPPRRRRRSALRRVIHSLILLAGCAVLAVFGLGLYGYVKFTGPGPLAQDKVFQVERGGVLGIAADLEKGGIISSANIFAAASTVIGDRGRLKPGEYQFKQAMSMRDVMNLIVSGRFITYKITIPEGWTTAQALDRLRENEVLKGNITLTPAEGQIMPDTYVFQRGETRDQIVKGMMAASQKMMDELWPQRAADAPVKTPAEALTLASIIEKETGMPEERARVASVFANRLRQGMPLQSDPTIIYGLTGGQTKLDRPLTRKDIEQATPYNTYRINGLPPGPIANPGRAALEAALSPAKTRDIYFVADGSGGHVFAETLEDHRVNVRKWREIEKKRNQGGEEAPVMDETDAAGPAPAVLPEPAPEAAAGQQGQNSSLPPVTDIEAAEQGSANPAPEPGADAAAPAPDNAGQGAQPPEQAAAHVPLPRPRPDKLTAATTAVADVTLDLRPGSVIKGANGLIPIPAPKPRLP
jgi:peptidoglycan lytic transglycosylase G